jgi:hypothetical protein
VSHGVTILRATKADLNGLAAMTVVPEREAKALLPADDKNCVLNVPD